MADYNVPREEWHRITAVRVGDKILPAANPGNYAVLQNAYTALDQARAALAQLEKGVNDSEAAIVIVTQQNSEARRALLEIRRMVEGATELPSYPANIPDLHDLILSTIQEVMGDDNQGKS